MKTLMGLTMMVLGSIVAGFGLVIYDFREFITISEKVQPSPESFLQAIFLIPIICGLIIGLIGAISLGIERKTVKRLPEGETNELKETG